MRKTWAIIGNIISIQTPPNHEYNIGQKLKPILYVCILPKIRGEKMSKRTRSLLSGSLIAIIVSLLTCLLLYFVTYTYGKQVLEITIIFILISTIFLMLINRIQVFKGNDRHEI